MLSISDLFDKLSTYADHHQALFAVIAGFSVICFTWGSEKLLEAYLFPNKPMVGYIAAIVVGLFILWFIQHFVMHVL